MVYQKANSIVINKKIYKESDLIVTVLTDRIGKISFIAKGVNSHKSNRGRCLVLGSEVSIIVYKKNNIYWLSDIKINKCFITNQKELNQIKYLFNTLEIINSIEIEESSSLLLFNLTKKIIFSIETRSFQKYTYYLIHLINELGYGIPANIISLYKIKNYTLCHQSLVNFIQSITERSLKTPSYL